MKLNKKAFALAGGVFWGFSLFFMTLFLVFFGDSSNEMMSSFSDFYFGYTVSVGGAFVGLVWGFLDGFVCGTIFSWLYNKFIK